MQVTARAIFLLLPVLWLTGCTRSETVDEAVIKPPAQPAPVSEVLAEPGTSPQITFERFQAALNASDWKNATRLLDTDSQSRIVADLVVAAGMIRNQNSAVDSAVKAIFQDHQFDKERVTSLQDTPAFIRDMRKALSAKETVDDRAVSSGRLIDVQIMGRTATATVMHEDRSIKLDFEQGSAGLWRLKLPEPMKGVETPFVRLNRPRDTIEQPFTFDPFAPPPDHLAAALLKHDNDLAAALEAIRARVTKNSMGAIVTIDFNSFDTTNDTLKHIADLVSLEKLDIGMTRHVNDDGMVHLRKLVNLEELNLFGNKVGDQGLEHIADKVKLEVLQLSGQNTDAGLKHLSELIALRTLEIGFGSEIDVTDTGVEHLKRLTSLERLRLDNCKVGDMGCAVIGRFTKLTSLSLGSPKVTDAGVAQLSELPLRAVSLAGGQITDEGLQHLMGLDLQYLNLSDTRTTDTGLAALQSFSHLSSLNLAGTSVSDAGLSRLLALPSLRQVVLDRTQVGNAGLKQLSTHSGINDLWISETAVTDEGLRHLSAMPQLQTLLMRKLPITDDGLRHLSGLGQLRQLDLNGSKVTAAGLQHLLDLPQLHDVGLYQTGVTDQQKQEFLQQKRQRR